LVLNEKQQLPVLLTVLIYWAKGYQKEEKETVLETSREVGLEVNTEKTKYLVISRHKVQENFIVY